MTQKELRKTSWEEEVLKDITGGRGAEIDTGRRMGEREFQKQLPSKRQHGTQSQRSLIGHHYLEKCKVGLDSAGYLQTERYYTLLIGSTRALLINQNENRHQEQRKREEGRESRVMDGGGHQEEENEVSSSRGERIKTRAPSFHRLQHFLVYCSLSHSHITCTTINKFVLLLVSGKLMFSKYCCIQRGA